MQRLEHDENLAGRLSTESLTAALTALAERHPKAKQSPGALVEWSLKEMRKVEFALPNVGAAERMEILVSHSFDHRETILQVFFQELSDTVPE